MSKKLSKLDVLSILIYVILGIFSLIAVFPFLWMISISLTETTFLGFPPQILPKHLTLSNYISILQTTNFFRWFINSTIVTSSIVAFNLLFNFMAGYAFAKKYFMGKNIIFFLILGTLMVPGHVLIIPVYLMFSWVRWVNTYQALILPGIANAFGIFLMKQYIETLPNELLDAAKIDGSSEPRIIFSIVFPLCKPVLAAVAIFSFLGAWNNFLWPLILTNTENMRTLPVGLAMFVSAERSVQWGLVMAGTAMTFFPALAIFLTLQKYFVRGIALTGIK